VAKVWVHNKHGDIAALRAATPVCVLLAHDAANTPWFGVGRGGCLR